MKLKSTLLLSGLLLLSACSTSTTTSQVTNFEECVAAGNPVMESYPRQCQHEGETFVENIEIPASENTETPESCTQEFEPVCGEIQPECFTTPCPPLKTTFQNRCEAEKMGAEKITEGECKDEAPNPEGACLSFDGNWLSDHNECEGMSQEMCENLGGEYNECASACRHNPEAEMCTLQCIQVCQF